MMNEKEKNLFSGIGYVGKNNNKIKPPLRNLNHRPLLRADLGPKDKKIDPIELTHQQLKKLSQLLSLKGKLQNSPR